MIAINICVVSVSRFAEMTMNIRKYPGFVPSNIQVMIRYEMDFEALSTLKQFLL